MDLQDKVNEVSKVYQNFEETFENVLDGHAPRQTKVLRSNHKSHVGRNLCKAIMKLLSLQARSNTTTLQDITKYSKH